MKLVRVLWQDAEGNDGWEDTEVFDKWAKEPLRLCETVAHLHSETETEIVLIGTVSHSQHMHGLKIPRQWIKSITELKESV